MLISFDNLVQKYNIKSNGVIHVGAHYGEEIPDYIRNGITNIVLFEPLEDNYKVLSENIKNFQANIELYKVALGSEIKKVTMYVSDNDKQSSSILKPKNHLVQHPDVYFPDTEDVEVNLLDNYNLDQYNFICMDVQGYELEVLKGSKNTLNHIDYVYCEVNRDEVYEGNAYIEEIDEYLKAYGLERMETNWAGGIWGDAFYLKKY
jgi:FkbM family methyltransferase